MGKENLPMNRWLQRYNEIAGKTGMCTELEQMILLKKMTGLGYEVKYDNESQKFTVTRGLKIDERLF